MGSESTTIISRDVAMRIMSNGGLVIDRWTKEVVWHDGEFGEYQTTSGKLYGGLPSGKWLEHPDYPIDIFSIEYPVSLWGVADRMLTDSPPGMLVVTKESEPNHMFSLAPGWLESQREKFREMREVKAAAMCNEIPIAEAKRVMHNGGLVVNTYTGITIWYDGDKYRQTNGEAFAHPYIIPDLPYGRHPEYLATAFNYDYPLTIKTPTKGCADKAMLILTFAPPGMLMITMESVDSYCLSIAPRWLDSQREKFRAMSEKAAPIQRRREYNSTADLPFVPFLPRDPHMPHMLPPEPVKEW
jgi:hypothetical protein